VNDCDDAIAHFLLAKADQASEASNEISARSQLDKERLVLRMYVCCHTCYIYRTYLSNSVEFQATSPVLVTDYYQPEWAKSYK